MLDQQQILQHLITQQKVSPPKINATNFSTTKFKIKQEWAPSPCGRHVNYHPSNQGWVEFYMQHMSIKWNTHQIHQTRCMEKNIVDF